MTRWTDMTHRKTYAQMWGCGCDCCCYQPRIVERSPLEYRDPGWLPPVLLEEGPWRSEPTREEWREQCEWLVEAARRHNVENLAEIEELHAGVAGHLRPAQLPLPSPLPDTNPGNDR